MPKILTQKKSSRGGVRKCGNPTCGEEIQAGEMYYIIQFRYGGKHFRCLKHPFKRSELTQSRMSEVYAAMEDAEDIVNFGTIEECKDAIQQLAETVREVAEAYREAAEHFGGVGENADRADELEGWCDELEQFEPEEQQEEFEEDEIGKEVSQEMFGIDDPNDLDSEQRMDWLGALQEKRDEWDKEHEFGSEEQMDDVRNEAMELLNQCPL